MVWKYGAKCRPAMPSLQSASLQALMRMGLCPSWLWTAAVSPVEIQVGCHQMVNRCRMAY